MVSNKSYHSVLLSRKFLLRHFFWRKTTIKELLINEQIRDKEIRLFGVNKEPLGIVSAQEAQHLADSQHLDLVMLNATATPRVCQIMDYGKYKYEMQKKEKDLKAKQKIVEIKEVQLSATIDVGDINTKAKAASKFLVQGNKVLVTLRLKGRQGQHQEIPLRVMSDFAAMLSDVAIKEKAPALNGRTISMVLAPIPNKK